MASLPKSSHGPGFAAFPNWNFVTSRYIGLRASFTRRAEAMIAAVGVWRLVALFVAWKALLLLVVCASPGPGYDTSTRVLFDQHAPSLSWTARTLEHAVLRSTRWDGIYFATSAERGHVNEQEWAFSWVLARCNHYLTTALFQRLPVSPIVKHALCYIILANASHLLAVITLYRLARDLIPTSYPARSRIAFTAALLHIVSPAGVFLSAPYGESTFAMLNFAGTWSYIRAFKLRRRGSTTQELLHTVLAGLLFALASTTRSNGLLSAILFVGDVVDALLHLRDTILQFRGLLRLVSIGIAGAITAIGFAAPQIVAFREYCTNNTTPRIWCERIPPSIYSWVQDHYWGVGFLRYWTLSNLPLFLLAAPMLTLLVGTASTALWRPRSITRGCVGTSRHRSVAAADEDDMAQILRRLAVPQLILAVMAATSFHIQIINRISSGYPLWYIALAIRLCSVSEKSEEGSTKGRMRNSKTGPLAGTEWIVRGMVMYAIIQGGLYASFLPPA